MRVAGIRVADEVQELFKGCVAHLLLLLPLLLLPLLLLLPPPPSNLLQPDEPGRETTDEL
jgi:hypothetical protein